MQKKYNHIHEITIFPIENAKTKKTSDILKSIQLLPGVQSSEGTSGFYVRGGGPDQNLILLDLSYIMQSKNNRGRVNEEHDFLNLFPYQLIYYIYHS